MTKGLVRMALRPDSLLAGSMGGSSWVMATASGTGATGIVSGAGGSGGGGGGTEISGDDMTLAL
jgi:hypothetical protein